MIETSQSFTIYPAIDLRQGRVVRLRMGELAQQITYSDDPFQIADRWLSAGARWLHVVNLDGAFGEADAANQKALEKILKVSQAAGASVQFGGGLRSLAAIQRALDLGTSRVVLGTVLVEQPDVVIEALQRWGPEQIAAGLDARDGFVRVHGWQEGTPLVAVELATKLKVYGMRWLVYTDIARDGLENGVNLRQTRTVAKASRLQVIASGGANSLEDVERVRRSGLAGVIIGQGLYSGAIDAQALFGKETGQN
ncbi:MAG: 1-(5-phosphoribosyl)-5-[(5-phosphoribosylamino)methylideneamino]imidazole-4-carboxamide isomerase [Anaerolineaceae bacterium]|nr:1-(5-phosphoribosyl)-5-[(5-phosphoribosylamino)methylideneamino]imidazole-4-carboxamide isomerase [Anaerolineaceae bacterium]